MPEVQSSLHRLGHESYFKIGKKRLLIGNKQSYNAKLFPDNLNFIFGIQLLTGRSALFLRQEFYKKIWSLTIKLKYHSYSSINTLDIIYDQFSTNLNGPIDLGLVLLLSAFPALLSLGCAVGLGLYYFKHQKPKIENDSGIC